MSYPFDQMTSLVSANQKLGQALFEVARVAAQRQAKIASQGLAVFTQAGAAPQVSPVSIPIAVAMAGNCYGGRAKPTGVAGGCKRCGCGMARCRRGRILDRGCAAAGS